MGQEKRGRSQRAGGRRVGASAAPYETRTKEPTPARRTRLQGLQDEQEQMDRETLVLPLVTLPTLPAVPRQGTATGTDEYGYGQYEDNGGYGDYGAYPESEYGAYPESEYGAQDGWDRDAGPPSSTTGTSLARYRADTQARPLKKRGKRAAALAKAEKQYQLEELEQRPTAIAKLEKVERRPTVMGSPGAARQYNRRAHPFDVLFVPGRNLSRRLPPGVRDSVNQAIGRLDFVRRHKMLLVTLALVAVLTSTLVAISNTTKVLSYIDQTAWQSLSGQQDPPTPTPPPAPDITSAAHYVAKYGFDFPGSSQALPSDERQRMVFMLPYAYRAAAAYDRRYNNSMEPELIVWWTHAEGIGARVNYSNCANDGTRPGTNYFTDIENCPQSSFWQLGYGNQFSVIYVLKNAFTDMYGNPNNAALVQKVGQWVLNYDIKAGTVPKCGGYSCTFPKLTIDQIMSGIDETTGVETPDNWWASVLSRDPAINCYMIAQALSFFNHAATLNWVGCYYYEPCWGYESNRLGDILSAWPSLRRAAHM